jgi:hypothetical protein
MSPSCKLTGRSLRRTMTATVQAEPMRVFGSIRSLDVRSLAGPVLDVNVPAGVHLTQEGHAIGTFFGAPGIDVDTVRAGLRA